MNPLTLLFDRKIKIVVNTTLHKYTFVDLHMDISAEMDRDKKPNKGTFVIYGLSEQTRKAISNDYRSVEIFVGYGSAEPSMVYLGSIINIYSEKIGTDWMTTIQALDGGEEYRNNIFNKSYAKGTPVITILTDVINSMGLEYEDSSLASAVTLSGNSYSGLSKDVLSKICDDNGLEWSIQRGVIEVVKKDEQPISALANVVLLGPDTGMVGSPTVDEDGNVTVQSLMNPEIRPNRLIKLMPANPATFVGFKMVENKKGKAFNVTTEGILVVDVARYTGSNYGSSFQVEAECKLK